MKTIRHPIDFSVAYPLERLGSLDELLFFDIETTGFSGDTDMVYLIGCVFFDAELSGWMMIQWFADSPDSETELLTGFFTLQKRYRKLIHFNGDTFDLPFLLKRCRKLNLPFDGFSGESVDLYRKIRPFKRILALDSLRQKAVEEFLGVARADVYSGGELIKVYADFLKSFDPFSFDLLLLHNEDDLKGMLRILPVLNYPDMVEGEFSLISQRLEEGEEHSLLTLIYESSCTVPVSFRTEGSFPGSLICGEGDRISCRIPLFKGELKHFYPNYKDYYYLPCEDTAIHKSVGVYVTGSARRRATAKTCYTKMSGLFVPRLFSTAQLSFQTEYGSKVSYLFYREDLFSEPGTADAFLRGLLFGPAISFS